MTHAKAIRAEARRDVPPADGARRVGEVRERGAASGVAMLVAPGNERAVLGHQFLCERIRILGHVDQRIGRAARLADFKSNRQGDRRNPVDQSLRVACPHAGHARAYGAIPPAELVLLAGA